MALRNIGVDYEVVGISEIDKYAIEAYETTHGEVNNLGDISKIKVDDIPEHDLFTYSFCCQDVSVAGKQKGIKRGETRSGLLYECERIIEHCKPKYLLMENVKNLVGKRFKPQFDEWLKYLENLGYTNYWQVLNAKDYGVPQNRERAFVVSILGDHKPYNFPKGFKLKKNIKSILEEDVNVKYYLSDETVKKLTLKKDFIVSSKDNTTTEHIVKVGNIYPSGGQNGNIYNPIGISPAISAGTGVNGNGIGSNNAPKIILANNTNQKDNYVLESNLKIRKLTPRECFRLMGVSEEDIDKIQAAGISETQQYKMAGNSIVVPVLEGIFRELFL
jgi:DNA (cytosine-5)-methyltransferase 1